MRVGSTTWPPSARATRNMATRCCLQMTSRSAKMIVSKLRPTVPAEQLPKRIREVEFLKQQADTMARIIDRNDASPGRGYVGFDAYQGD